ncbi:MAG: TetR/AcrR family transcriptional regulator [Solirubrobacteraceae bacterium]
MVDVVAERGAGNVTVAHIVARSGVSRRTFYELFADREDCFLAAFDETVSRIAESVIPAYEESSRWVEGMRGGLVALLGFLQADPAAGRLVIVEALAAGASALEHRARVLTRVISAVDAGRREARSGDGLSPMVAEGIVGGVLAVLHSRLIESETIALPELTGPLMSMIVSPYLGSAAARQELARPTPKPQAKPHTTLNADPLRELQMRLTYRTVRVLTAVAELSGQGSCPSNREVSIAAGMSDQGQTSKLLSRLHRLELIENTGAGPSKGAPNAWKLTAKGTEVEQALAGQSTQPAG